MPFMYLTKSCDFNWAIEACPLLSCGRDRYATVLITVPCTLKSHPQDIQWRKNKYRYNSAIVSGYGRHEGLSSTFFSRPRRISVAVLRSCASSTITTLQIARKRPLITETQSWGQSLRQTYGYFVLEVNWTASGLVPALDIYPT